MSRWSPRLTWNLPTSLGLSLAIVALGSYGVLAQRASLSETPDRHAHAYGVQPADLGPVAAASDWIVEGVVTEVYPGEWTTTDKNPPTRMDEMFTNQNIQLRTPVLLDISRVHKGDLVPGTVLFTLPGGSSDDVTVSSPFGFAPRAGERVLVFLSHAPKDAGPWAEISPLYPQLIFLADGADLHGPDATISRHQLTAQLGLEG